MVNKDNEYLTGVGPASNYKI